MHPAFAFRICENTNTFYNNEASVIICGDNDKQIIESYLRLAFHLIPGQGNW